MSRNFGLSLALPRSALEQDRLASQTSASTAAITGHRRREPNSVSSAPPRKKPTPLSAFFDPVSTATQRYSAPGWSSGTSSLMLLLALILFRSLAMPDSACAAITQGTVSHAAGTSSMHSAATCRPRPMFMVRFKPIRAPSQPPTRLVMTPNNS